MIRKCKPIEDRFWPKVDKRGPDECWPWLASTTKGYGVIGVGRAGSGNEYAHRVSWQIANGPIPSGLMVLHHCDNPVCVNPRHLYAGSDVDNKRDMASRNRCALAKLSLDDVRWVREWYAAGWSQRLLGLAVGCNQQNVSSIVGLKTRQHV